MADETKTAVITIDLNIADSAKSMADLLTLQKSLNKEFQNAQIGTDTYVKLQAETSLVDKAIKNLNADTKAFTTTTEAQTGSVAALQAQYKTLLTAIKNTAPGNDVLGQSYETAKQSAADLKAQIASLQAVQDTTTAKTEVQVGSIRDLQVQYNALANALKSAAPGSEVLGLSFDDAKKKAVSLKTSITTFDQSLGNFQANVGNYGGALKEASLNTGIFSQQTQAISGTFQGVSSGLKVVTSGFSTVRGAMLAIPIFALIAAFTTLVGFFTKTEEGAELLEQIVGGLSAAFDVVIGRAAMLGKAFVQFFSGDFAGAAKTAEAAFTGIGDAIVAATKAGVNYQKVLQDIEDQSLVNSVEDAKRANQVDLLIKQSKDRTLSETERLALLDKAGTVEANGVKKSLDLLKQRAVLEQEALQRAIANGKVNKGNTTEEAAAAEIAYQNAVGASEEKLAAIQARRSAFLLQIKSEAEAAVKAEQDRITKLREIEAEDLARRIADLNTYDKAAQDLANQRIQNDIKDNNNALADEQEYLNSSLENNQISQQDKLNLIQLSTNKQNQIVADTAKKQTDLELNNLLVSLDNEKLVTDQKTALLEQYAQTKADIEAQAALQTQKNDANALKQTQDQAKKMLDLQKKQQASYATSIEGTLGAISGLFDQQSEEYKIAATGQAIISTYLGANAALATGEELGPEAGFIAAGAVIVEGLANVAKINGIQFADGGIAHGIKQGIIGGNSHSQGGTTFHGSDGSMFVAESGELLTVVNKHDTARLNTLSNLNSGHGKPFFAQGGIAYDGGMSARTISDPVFNAQRQMNDFIKISQSIPAPVVGVADIMSASQKRSGVRAKANLTKNN